MKDIIDSTSITDMCDISVCHWVQPNEEKHMWVHKVFEKVIVAFLLFYSMKTIIYFIALKHHSF
ncbi:hypothetical protein CN468_04550 [Bacillus cereus]|nr:hypothetical protein CN468_04550 [Bacillus cereus]